MHFQTAILTAAAVFGIASSAAAAATDDKAKDPLPKPCTIRSSSTGNFFDLNNLYVEPPKKDKDPKDAAAAAAAVAVAKDAESWKVKGYDYGANFTLNICGPVVEELDDVVGVTGSSLKNVSAYYTKGKESYSIGCVLRLSRLC
jgi:cation-dependent mannose-6-phosphate receptor